jgi:hypothetical protein
MQRRWLTDDEGRQFRNIPVNLADRDRAIAPWTWLRLHREFKQLWREGLIYKDEER